MHVLVNGLAALKPKTGVGHYVTQLVDHMAALAPEDQFSLYPGPLLGRLITRLVHAPSQPRPTVKNQPASRWTQFRGAAFGWAKETAKTASSAHFLASTRLSRADLYFEPNFIPYRSHLPTVVTVHDLSVVRHPEWHPIDRVRFHDRHFFRCLERASHVLVVSESVRQELLADSGLSPNQVTTVHNGVHPYYCPQPDEAITGVRVRYQLPQRYFLSVGTIEPRKNIGTILRAFVDMPASQRAECPLVLAGPWGWKSQEEREYFETVAAPRGARHLGYVPDADLPALYAGAAALLYPSFYEGFGFPPLEMLACGGAVLASTADAVREVLAGHGCLIDPHDVTDWREAMSRIVSHPEWADTLRRGGLEHAGDFTWERAARATLSALRTVRDGTRQHQAVNMELRRAA
ncbi:MAG: glycosyltransferase family 4 protein [Bacteroidales bacterium]|nr:glycosyltransferase family 4 protein [Bacteroidales bacterium]